MRRGQKLSSPYGFAYKIGYLRRLLNWGMNIELENLIYTHKLSTTIAFGKGKEESKLLFLLHPKNSKQGPDRDKAIHKNLPLSKKTQQHFRIRLALTKMMKKKKKKNRRHTLIYPPSP
ncbi:hypothetical protein H5410_051288 [Solanum commersonii]|uniref:Uncharacterized protein n=1 Tax=Solanum commersonii TaxID=4109 RepID=A0A9J5WZK4_SOLCO|nr:hypothetical protein H5410_051288 [Solanum commersonii]